MIRSAIIYALLLLMFAWPLGWLTMLLSMVAFIIGIGVGAVWEDERHDREAVEDSSHTHMQIVRRPQ